MGMPTEPTSLLLEQALLALDRLAVAEILKQVSSTAAPVPPIDAVVVPALKRIGDAWEDGRVSLSQVYMSGRILEDVLAAVLPPGGAARKAQPRTAIATLADYHFLGKRIVYCTLRTSGYDLLDYGHTEVDSLVQQVEADRIEVLLLSTLMLPSALKVAEVRSKLNARGLHPKIVVGGAPFRFDPQLWKEVGADAMGTNSAQAIEIVSDMARLVA